MCVYLRNLCQYFCVRVCLENENLDCLLLPVLVTVDTIYRCDAKEAWSHLDVKDGLSQLMRL